MRRFRDTFDATRGDNEADRKRFEDVKKRAEADVYLRGRSFAPADKRTDKRPKPVSDPE
jgi:hypothetical protein